MPNKIVVDRKEVCDIIDRWGKNPEYVIEIMQDIQERYRHLPRAALQQVSSATHTDLARLYHVATFYQAFSLQPRGEIPIQVCTGTACHVQGAQRVMDAFSRELDLRPGDTTEDLQFSLDGVRCLGCCSLAPVVAVGKKLQGGLDSAKVGKLLDRYRKTAQGKETRDAQGND